MEQNCDRMNKQIKEKDKIKFEAKMQKHIAYWKGQSKDDLIPYYVVEVSIPHRFVDNFNRGDKVKITIEKIKQ